MTGISKSDLEKISIGLNNYFAEEIADLKRNQKFVSELMTNYTNKRNNKKKSVL